MRVEKHFFSFVVKVPLNTYQPTNQPVTTYTL